MFTALQWTKCSVTLWICKILYIIYVYIYSLFRAPKDARFTHFWCTRTEIHPLQVCPVCGIDPLNWQWGVCSRYKIFHYASAWKSGNSFPLIRHSCNLGSSAMLSAQLYIPHVFKHCDLLVLKIMILWEAMCITLYSQNPNTTFKIRFWVFTHGLWRAGSSEHRVIPSKLMKRSENTP